MATDAPNKHVYIQTFGCQMNVYDSEKMLSQLQASSFSPIDDPLRADLILVNTCAIRENAENKVFSLLGSFAEIKSNRPDLVIGVGGCVAQQQGQEILKRAPVVDMVFGTDNLFELPEMLAEVAQGKRPVRTEFRHQKQKIVNFVPDLAPDAASSTLVKGSIAITKGCNNFCTFCVVPYTRGREVSREPDNIIQEAERLVGSGVKEITLLGQNVNSYKAMGVDFVALLERMNDLEGLDRIRYTSPHPKDLNEKLARAHRDLPKLCEHIHLPYQAGSDSILKAMRRNHKISEYLEKVAMIREYVPNIAISTDIIVGFPGETPMDFEATLEVLEKVRFDQVYAFKYSPRADTPAATLENQVPEVVRAERLAVLFEKYEAILAESNRSLIGSKQEVLLEGPHPKVAGAMNGRSRGNKSVMVLDCNAEPGTLLDVEIAAARKFSLVAGGERLENQ